MNFMNIYRVTRGVCTRGVHVKCVEYIYREREKERDYRNFLFYIEIFQFINQMIFLQIRLHKCKGVFFLCAHAHAHRGVQRFSFIMENYL